MTRLEELLENTSRTFALSIPVLPEPTRRQVMIAYLLFRIADTFTDSLAHLTGDADFAAIGTWQPADGFVREYVWTTASCPPPG